MELGHFCLPVSPVTNSAWRNWQQNKQHLLADVQNVLAKHEMFEEIGGGETRKQGQEVESVSCQAKNVGQFRQALTNMSLLDRIERTISKCFSQFS